MTTQKTAQEMAIDKVEGPCLIKAGAGTGKTYTLVKKITKLVNGELCKPEEILCLTFSNEATNNLKKSVDEELKTSSEITINTFHAFCADILKEMGNKIGISPDFDILPPEDSKILMHKYLGVDAYNSNRYVQSISTAKDFGVTIEKLNKHLETLKSKFEGIADIDTRAREMDLEFKTLHLVPAETKDARQELKEKKAKIKEFIENYEEYEKYKNFIDAWGKYELLKKEKNYQDYSDLNFNALKVLSTYGEGDISKKFKYIFVDEFQDTNKLQFDLIELLARDHKNITVVGDPNQSIYAFRGSFGGVFGVFENAFELKKTDIFNLDKSRRSPNKVLQIAHELIKKNYAHPEECIQIENFEGREGEKIKIFELKNGSEEARKVAEIVEKDIEEGTPLDEICILYRSHKQGKEIEQALEAKNIPLISAGETDLMQKPEIRTVIAYLGILNNLQERTGTGEQSWWNLFHYQNTLSPQDSIKIGRYLKSKRDEGMSIDFASIIELTKLDLSESGKKLVERITNKLSELIQVSNTPLPELILDIYELTGLNRQFTHSRTPRNIEGLMNLKTFYDVAKNYYEIHDKNLNSFINYLEILERIGIDIPASKIENINAVRLMTIHAVKGLEFDKVIVTNLADNRFPLERTRNEPLIPKHLNPDIKLYLEQNGIQKDDEEAIKEYEKNTLLLEERRLCYVAFTRAKKELILTFSRSYNGKEDFTSASTFLHEINYKENKNTELIQDNEEKCTLFAPCSQFEQHKSLLKKQLIDSLDTDDINNLLSRLVTYYSVREGKVDNFNINLDKLVDKKELETHINKHLSKISGLKFDKNNFTFSPTALETYDDCPKKYELQNIFQMPERGFTEFSGASTGSFMHKLLEIGVKEMFDSKEMFIVKAKQMSTEPEWKGIDLEDVNALIYVFWARHRGRYNNKTLTEQKLFLELGGFKFFGITDRIDFLNSKDIEIIDYKTNTNPIEPKKRAWQLGFYAIGAKKALKLNPTKLTLEMLRLEKPLEAELDEEGNVTSGRTKGFNINEIEKELIETANKIMKDYEGEFIPTKDEKNCRFCKLKFYCPKWEEK
ncbi:MAG: ATP-dependent DNA helicase [archaeon]|jgi:DNA helicase-2/ATP-dependent DNA helicase PcrA